MSVADRVRVHDVTLLSDHWYVLKTTRFDFLRRDGHWQTQARETYDRGNGAAILLYNLAHQRPWYEFQFGAILGIENQIPDAYTRAVQGFLLSDGKDHRRLQGDRC